MLYIILEITNSFIIRISKYTCTLIDCINIWWVYESYKKDKRRYSKIN
jgi:hypothetical protein